jgi:glycosyltransferase involved in cell wall biosynthesis
VLSVAYPLAPVGPDSVGGAERVLTALDRALVAAGHRSLVLAAEGSVTAGDLIPFRVPGGRLEPAVVAAARRRYAATLAAALLRARGAVDVVHLHGVDFAGYLPPPGPPALVTLHLPLSWYPAGALHPSRPATHLHCVSAAQRRTAPPGVELLQEIPNGVDLAAFRPLAEGRPKGDFALALGRICAEKGFHLAFDAAERAGVPLVLGGSVFPYPEHERYFAREIAPRLSPERRHVGALDLAAKARRLAEARCLLVPSLAAETSSLVAMEALASGTPVVAFRAGALPEIVEHGRTGFLVDGPEEMAAAIGRVGELDPRACRAAAEARFSEARMTASYLRLYGRLAEAPAESLAAADAGGTYGGM